MIEINHTELKYDQLILLYISNPISKTILFVKVNSIKGGFKVIFEHSNMYWQYLDSNISTNEDSEDSDDSRRRLLFLKDYNGITIFKLSQEEEELLSMEFI